MLPNDKIARLILNTDAKNEADDQYMHRAGAADADLRFARHHSGAFRHDEVEDQPQRTATTRR